MIDPRVHPFNINKQQKVGGEQLTYLRRHERYT